VWVKISYSPEEKLYIWRLQEDTPHPSGTTKIFPATDDRSISAVDFHAESHGEEYRERLYKRFLAMGHMLLPRMVIVERNTYG
jgi:hypothetical protein